VVVGGAVTACAGRSAGEGSPPTAPTQVEESSRYGDDRVVGLLQVTAKAAYFEYGSGRIVLVGAPPVTAVGAEALMIRTAEDLRHLAGRRVRARGDLQGDVLWGAEVTPTE
jgi:hypothetical protein